MRLSVLGVLAFYVAANAYVAARTSLFLHRNLPERAAKRLSFWTAGIYAIFACGMPIAHFLPEGALRKGILRVSYGFYGIFIYLVRNHPDLCAGYSSFLRPDRAKV